MRDLKDIKHHVGYHEGPLRYLTSCRITIRDLRDVQYHVGKYRPCYSGHTPKQKVM